MSQRSQKDSPALPLSRYERLLNWFLALPRIIRIILAAIFALATTLALSPIVDKIYVDYFFTEQTRILPSLISTGFGLVMYVTGWMLFIGTVGDDPPPRFAVLWYFVLGWFAILLALLWFVQGITSVNTG